MYDLRADGLGSFRAFKYQQVMTREEMKNRTKGYANRIVKLCSALPADWVAQTMGKQTLRCGTSVGANYRAVCRAKSKSDFINKLRIVEEECDESMFWMELLSENRIIESSRLSSLMQEANAILSIVVAAAKTARIQQRVNLQNSVPRRGESVTARVQGRA
jgi:four helix bundle protein